jgi:hypothetical protein
MPEAHAGESSLRRDFHALAKIMQTTLVAHGIRSNRERPERPNQFKGFGHGVTLQVGAFA